MPLTVVECASLTSITPLIFSRKSYPIRDSYIHQDQSNNRLPAAAWAKKDKRHKEKRVVNANRRSRDDVASQRNSEDRRPLSRRDVRVPAVLRPAPARCALGEHKAAATRSGLRSSISTLTLIPSHLSHSLIPFNVISLFFPSL